LSLFQQYDPAEQQLTANFQLTTDINVFQQSDSANNDRLHSYQLSCLTLSPIVSFQPYKCTYDSALA